MEYSKAYKRYFYYSTLLLICISIVFRIFIFLYSKDMYLDDYALFHAINDKSLIDIIWTGLGNSQSAPLLFVMFNKVIIYCGGQSIKIITFFPFICSVISIYVIYKICVRFFNIYYAFVAIFLYSLCSTPLYFSSVFKQYSIELLINLLLIYFAVCFYIKVNDKETQLINKKILLLYIISILSSSTSVFIIPSIILCEAVYLALKTEYNLKKILSTYQCLLFVLLGIFFVLYFMIYLKTANTSSMQNFWKDSFIPLSVQDLVIYIPTRGNGIYQALFYPKITSILVIVGFAPGLFFLYKYNKYYFFILVLPICTTLAANIIVYPPGHPGFPHGGRLLLFLIPNIIIVASSFYAYLFGKIYTVAYKRRKLNLFRPYININVNFSILTCLLLSLSVNMKFIEQKQFILEQTTQLLNVLSENITNNDKFYLFFTGNHHYNYYLRFSKKKIKPIIFNSLKDLWEKFKNESDISSFAYVLFTHYGGRINPRELDRELNRKELKFIKLRDIGSILYIIVNKEN